MPLNSTRSIPKQGQETEGVFMEPLLLRDEAKEHFKDNNATVRQGWVGGKVCVNAWEGARVDVGTT